MGIPYIITIAITPRCDCANLYHYLLSIRCRSNSIACACRITSYNVCYTKLLRAARRLEDELRLKEVYEQLFENACEGLAAFNRQGEVVYANRQALSLVGYRRDELLGARFASLLSLPSLRQFLRRQP